MREIKSEEWMPDPEKGILNYTPDFVSWINSINRGFQQRRINYKPFNLYCQQAEKWLEEDVVMTDSMSLDQQRALTRREIIRSKQNSYYYANRFLFMKEGDEDSGTEKFQAWEAQKIVMFLMDCGYSQLIGKGRQIGFSTVIGGCATKKIAYNKNYFVKFITHTKEKGEEIFEDKVKFAYENLVWWMKPTPGHYRENIMRLFVEEKKGDLSGIGSKMQVVTPKADAINGGAPNLVLIDEIGSIKLFSKMMTEGRPTLFRMDKKTGKLVMRRQVIAWGCVCAGTKVWTNKGHLLNVEDLIPEDGILGYDGNGISKEPITWMAPPAKKPCYRITVEGGDSIECSYDHPLMWGNHGYRTSYNKKKITFKRASDIKTGDQLMMIGEVPLFGRKSVEDSRLLGLMIGDGNYSFNSMPQLSVVDSELREYLNDNYSTKVYRTKELTTGGVHEKTGIRNFIGKLRDHGMYGQSKEKKRLPVDIDDFDKNSVAELIGGYFDADGNVGFNESKGVIRIVLTSIVRELLIQVKFQLLKFGITSSIHKEKRTGPKLSDGQKLYIYRLYISNQDDVMRFKKEIKFLCRRKQFVLNRIDELSAHKRKFGFIKDGIFVMNSNGKGKHFVGNKSLKGLRHRRVTKVEFIGEKPIYNLSAGKTHTYLANGFVTANTGGEMEKAGHIMESEWIAAMAAWDRKDYEYGLIPIFFDAYARDGMSKEFYEAEKIRYYSKTGPEAIGSRTQFHQHYPMSPEDMFLVGLNTVIPIEQINTELQRIIDYEQENTIEYGYFEPVYDMNHPYVDDKYMPYKIKSVIWRAASGPEDPRVRITIFKHPASNYVNRYYKGTDPVNSETGHSKMSSAIWDSYENEVSAVLNYRSDLVKDDYVQSIMLSMHYGLPYELLEINIGEMYADYLDSKRLSNKLVPMKMLPQYMQTATNRYIGIHNNAGTGKHIINKLIELLDVYKGNIYIREFYIQLKTFVEKITPGGKSRFQAQDLKYYFDDVIFAIIYAYLAAECYAHLTPRTTEEAKKKKKRKTRWVRDKNNNVRLAETDRHGKIIRYRTM